MLAVLSQGPLFFVCLVFLLGIVVIVHELGHYWAGRYFGAAVESYSVGFGKSIFEHKDKNNTRWRVNWIPLGGFVKFVGEHQLPTDVGKLEHGPKGKVYSDLGPLQRSVVSLAGPFANFVLASIIFTMIFMFQGVQPVKTTVINVTEGTPAEQAGFQVGDIVKSAAGRDMRLPADFTTAIALNPNTQMDVVVERDGDLVSLKVTPIEVVEDNGLGQIVSQARVGVGYRQDAIGDRIRMGPVSATWGGIKETGRTLENTVHMLHRIITGRMSVHTMSGPVGIGDASRRVVNRVMDRENVTFWNKIKDLFWIQLSLCAAVSVGIGFFNLLPMPVLDGGHVVFNTYEAVTGNALPEKIQELSLTFGVILLLGIVVLITWGDVLETGLFR